MIGGTGLLAATAELGEYFAIDALGVGQGEEIAALVTDAVAVRAFVDRTRSAIAESMHRPVDLVPLRMAGSAFHLNVVARLVSPAVGAAVALGTVPLLTLASVRWRTTAHHVPRFGVTDLVWAPAPTPSRAAESIAASLLATVIDPLNRLLRAALSLSTHVTRGNVISAANGAVSAMAMSRPDLEPRGRELVRSLLLTESLSGTGRFIEERFVRHSCCLFYRAPGNGLCGDCVLAAPPGSAHP